MSIIYQIIPERTKGKKIRRNVKNQRDAWNLSKEYKIIKMCELYQNAPKCTETLENVSKSINVRKRTKTYQNIPNKLEMRELYQNLNNVPKYVIF